MPQDTSRETPRLYLILPPIPDAAQFKPLLAAALAAGDIACVLLRQSGTGDIKALAQALMPLVQENDAAFLVEGDPRLAARIGADGTHVTYSDEAIESALSSLGPDRIVGAGGLATRDDAMNAGEAGASYVMFGEPNGAQPGAASEQVRERVAWWAEIFNIPCVGYCGNLEEIGPLAEAGAEFVALGEAVWDHPGGPGEAVRSASTILASTVLSA
jgi:thiamine-phosphate pyrophosphorylase